MKTVYELLRYDIWLEEDARKIGSWKWTSDELEALTPEEVVEAVKEGMWLVYDPRKKGTGDSPLRNLGHGFRRFTHQRRDHDTA